MHIQLVYFAPGWWWMVEAESRSGNCHLFSSYPSLSSFVTCCDALATRFIPSNSHCSPFSPLHHPHTYPCTLSVVRSPQWRLTPYLGSFSNLRARHSQGGHGVRPATHLRHTRTIGRRVCSGPLKMLASHGRQSWARIANPATRTPRSPPPILLTQPFDAVAYLLRR